MIEGRRGGSEKEGKEGQTVKDYLKGWDKGFIELVHCSEWPVDPR